MALQSTRNHEFFLLPPPLKETEKAHEDRNGGIDQKQFPSSNNRHDTEPEVSRLNGEETAAAVAEEGGRERLKRHRKEIAGRVWIPDIWGQEELLKDWIDCSAFDESLFPSGIGSARAALVEEGRRASINNGGGLRLENREPDLRTENPRPRLDSFIRVWGFKILES